MSLSDSDREALLELKGMLAKSIDELIYDDEDPQVLKVNPKSLGKSRNKAWNKRLPMTEDMILRCVEAALSWWNHQNQLQGTEEYELVEPLGCASMRGPSIHHCNFIARPKNSSEAAENKLFFAELMHDYDKSDFRIDDRKRPMRCDFCCILGSPGLETGCRGCKICDLDPGLVHHPEHGFKKIAYFPVLDHLTHKDLILYHRAEKAYF